MGPSSAQSTTVGVGGPPLVRPAVVAQVADTIPESFGDDCVRVAVDGVDGAGKTVFADELAAELAARGRAVVRVSADDWHQVRDLRYARGRTSPEGFWLDSYDYPRLRAEVLDPLGRGGSRDYRPRGHDLSSDEVLTGPLAHAPAGAVVLLDGLFLQRAELEGCFELAIWLDVPFEETAARMAVRDGSPPDPGHPSMRRYVEAQRTYFAERTPWERADVVVDNTDFAAPFVVTARFD
ncbi:uridine kinase [Pedococcus dokdonensis]|uniref:Uridine kinase n=1 Tax=Pedococcus dokdonensis TaxID=443156 RepID=A0A1H0TVP4_9MICO|nr:uridine kinase [Pedococcus dokdonensis]SDP58127.1 uridine kinase [Pedococcus dokdonensis]